MSKFVEPENITLLLGSVAQRFGHKPQSPREFKCLSRIIHDITGESVSDSTLKRLWGYDRNYGSPYRYTLDILARYLGYDSAQDFFDKMASVPQVNSSSSQNLNTSQTSPKSARSALPPNPAQDKNPTHNSAARGRAQRDNFYDGAPRHQNWSRDIIVDYTPRVFITLRSRKFQIGHVSRLYLSPTCYIELRYCGHYRFEVVDIRDELDNHFDPPDSPM